MFVYTILTKALGLNPQDTGLFLGAAIHDGAHAMGELLSAASRWCLIIGIAAMGMRTSFKEVLSIGPRAIALLCIETFVLALIVLV